MNMAEDLAGLVDRLGLKTFHLVGHSFGGLVSLSYARRYPHRLRSLVLADVPLNEINAAPEWRFWWPSLMKFQNLGIVIPWDEPYPELMVLEELARPQIRQRVGKLLPETAHLPYGWGKGTDSYCQTVVESVEYHHAPGMIFVSGKFQPPISARLP